MTIKDNGGVFGRNPSFNDVEANDLIAGNVEIPQGGKLYIGNGAGPGALPRGDLEIYHDGSNSRIDVVFAGNLIIRAHDRIQFQGYVSGKNFVIMQDGGAVSLWFDGGNKFQTTAAGVNVTGALSLNGGISWSSGAGSPEGVVTAPPGSLYSNTSGGLLTTLYFKETGTGNTGWIAK
jgi:hypothetical protein